MQFALIAHNYTLSGYVKDQTNGETLIGATVFLSSDQGTGTATNAYGFYSLSLPKGTYKVTYAYLGFKPQSFEINLDEDVELDVELNDGVFMDEVIVSAEKEDEKKNFESTQMGTLELPVEEIKKLPALMGEVDVLKSIQLLPGVMSFRRRKCGILRSRRRTGPESSFIR